MEKLGKHGEQKHAKQTPTTLQGGEEERAGRKYECYAITGTHMKMARRKRVMHSVPDLNCYFAPS